MIGSYCDSFNGTFNLVFLYRYNKRLMNIFLEITFKEKKILELFSEREKIIRLSFD